MTARAEFMRRLAGLLARDDGHEPLPLRLCRTAVELAQARDGTIALGISDRERHVVCATSSLARRFEDAQDLVGEGPAFDVLRADARVSSSGVAALSARWPALTGVVAGLPVVGLDALPMRPGRRLVGVLSVYRDTTAPLRLPEEDLQFIADTIGAAVVEKVQDGQPGRLSWGDRDRIAQATGMVVVQLGVTTDDAAALLRAHAFAEETSLVDISVRVVRRELRFSPPEGS